MPHKPVFIKNPLGESAEWKDIDGILCALSQDSPEGGRIRLGRVRHNVTDSMHLDRKQAHWLVAALNHWLETGKLIPQDGGTDVT